MADIERSSEAVWHGSLREGGGTLTTTSGVLKQTDYTWANRFDTGKGTNPEELLAAAHAACFSMALASALSKKDFTVHHVTTRATVHLSPQQPSGFKITRIHLETRGKVDDVEEHTFKLMAEETKKTCIVSQALSAVEMDVDAALES